MARTRKELFKQNLNAIPVYIQDNSQESVYFNIKQLNSYFTGGKNGFLITGTGLLESGTEISIEILDVNGNPIFLEAIKNFSEAGSRLITVEVYENTPRGSATLTIIGTAKQTATGEPVPPQWQGTQNVSWQKKLIIEPKQQNSTPIRIKQKPEILTEELLLTGSFLSQSIIIQPISNVKLQPKSVLNKQKGYTVIKNFPFAGYQQQPTITGSLTLEKRKYTGTIPSTTEDYVVLARYSSSVNIPLNILNSSRAFTDVNILDQNGNILDISTLSNGQYELEETTYTASSNSYVRIAANITGSINYQYISESVTLNTDSVSSFAKLRIINLSTVSGQIFRVKSSVRQAASQTDFQLVADTSTAVGELLITGSTDQDDREQPTGYFVDNNILNSAWYAHSIIGSTIPDVSYGDDNISSSTHINLNRSDLNIINSAYAVTTGSNYFIGTRKEVELFPTSEYTLRFDSYVSATSGSNTYNSDKYNLDIYLTGSVAVDRNPLGQKIGSINTSEQVAYFPNKSFNFTVPKRGDVGIRFVVNDGFWEVSNISLKVAEEYAFNPDEVTITIPNNAANSSSLIFKTDLFDLNNNALDLDIQSSPTYFQGSNVLGGTVTLVPGLLSSSTQILNFNVFATTGSNKFVGNQIITGSLTVSGSSTFTNIGPAVFSGSEFSGIVSGSGTQYRLVVPVGTNMYAT